MEDEGHHRVLGAFDTRVAAEALIEEEVSDAYWKNCRQFFYILEIGDGDVPPKDFFAT